MNQYPKVSIVTPSFNQGDFLEATICSVLNQDYPNIEYIIIDGGSKDNSVDIIKKYEHKIAYWISEPDGGQTEAIIKGFEQSTGEFITWLCSDDIIEPSMVSISVAMLEKHPEWAMTFGDRVRYDAKSNIIGCHRYCEFRPWLLKWGFAIPQETMLMRHEAYNLSGGLDKSLKMAMDFDLFCKLSKIGKIKHIPVYLGRFRSHSNNKSTLFNNAIEQSGFNIGAPLELAEVYKTHFNKPFSVWKWKRVSLLNEILSLIDRRSSKYQSEKNQILSIR